MGGTLPIAVQNLRRIWEKRKKSLEINQSQAAETLGWTQGAFSQYLNNITELHDEAVAKLANFLEVDPHEIDPEYQPIEAQLVRVPVRYVHGKTAAPSTKIMYRRRVPISVQKTNFHATCAIELAKDSALWDTKANKFFVAICLCSTNPILSKVECQTGTL